MGTETYQKRLLWVKLNQIHVKPCSINVSSTRLVASIQGLETMKTTIYMINHYSLIAQLLRYTKMSTERLAKED
jgi:hypothetical protein